MINIYHSTARAQKLAIVEEMKAGAWVHAVAPSEADLDKLAADLQLDRDVLKDATDPHEAPRVEVGDGATYVFARYCRPEDPDIPTEPMLIIYTASNIITVMRSDDKVLDNLINGNVPLITTQRTKAFLYILDQINRSTGSSC